MKSARIMYKSCQVFLALLLLAQSAFTQKDGDQKVADYLGQFAYYEYMDWDSAKLYLDSAVIAGEESSDPVLLGKIDLNQGWYYQDISMFNTSRSYFFRALDHFTEAQAYNEIADVYGNIGNAFLDVGDLKSALDYQLKSLETNEAIIILSKDEESIDQAIRGRAYAWSNISNIYKILGQYRKSIDYQIKALDFELQGEDSVGMGISYLGLGTSYDDLDLMDSALYFTNLAHGIFIRHQYSYGLVNSYITLYKFGEEQGNPRLDYLLNAYNLAREFQDSYAEVFALGYLVSGDFGFSVDSLDRMVNRGNKLLKEFNLEGSVFSFYLDEAHYKASVGRYQEAYNSLDRYIELYTEQRKNNEQVDFKNAELRHEYQLQSLQDSLAFQEKINQQRLENERQVSRQRTIIAISVFGFLILTVFIIFIFRSLRLKKATNLQLSEKNSLIEKQKEIVEEKNKEITDSITYAKRLQYAILPAADTIRATFSDSFIYYCPKDVVSGDFYWYEQADGLDFVAAADCTGHGVPGAMVSVVCSNALNRTVNEFGLRSPAQILNKTRELVIETFAKSGENVKDGMDINLCVFDPKNAMITYCGANNPLWIVRSNELLSAEELNNGTVMKGDDFALIEFKANKEPIGLYADMQPFEEIDIQVHKGDVIYLFTDGYADQFGGENGKKLKYRNFKQLLVNHPRTSMEELGDILASFMKNWIGDYEQVDDICVIGIRV